ncbi:hypothetical protein [Gordonia caeni]|uniref:PASTA domain-containing protein n=1 Tax=Gordonia caeni TaxID=1007097 RepID=A0ABP7P7V5_9ACTN
MRRVLLAAGMAGMLAVTACGSSGEPAPTVTVTATPSSSSAPPQDTAKDSGDGASSTPTSSAPPADDAAADTDGKKGVMPEVICLDLQAAQNKIQDNGVFFSRSEDATGKARQQVWDRNWIVVAQRPAAGEPIGEGDAVLSVVKKGEPNDCPGQ